jgi:hypothetical protein
MDERFLKSIALQNSINPSTATFSLQLFTAGANNVISNKLVFVRFIDLLDWSYSDAAGARLPVEYINVAFQRTPATSINDMRTFSAGPGSAVLSSPQYKFVDGEMFVTRRFVNLFVNTNQIINTFSVNVRVPTPLGTEYFICSFRLYWEEIEEKTPSLRSWERILKK